MARTADIDEALATLKQGEVAGGLLHVLADVLASLDAETDRRVFARLQEGALTSEEALTAWGERHALSRLRRKLEVMTKRGRRASETLGEHV